MALFDSGLTNISILIDQPFPSNVVSGPGVRIDKTSSVWSVGLDFTDLTDGGSPATPSNVFLAGYDVALQRYEKLRLDNMIAGATGLDARTPRGDADYSVLITDRYIGLTAALTAVRTWTLPAANTVPAGRVVTIQDEAGGISGASHINFVPTGSDTLNGLANHRLKTKFGGIAFRSDGSSKWSIAYSWQVSAVADANYTAQQGDLIIAYTSITAARTVTLPAANAYPAGQRLTIIDFSGACSGTNTIGISRSSPDLINGATSQTISQAYGYLALISDGASKWTIVNSSAVAGSQISGAINGVTIGATTPATGTFTTLSTTGQATLASVTIGGSGLTLSANMAVTVQSGGLAAWSGGTLAGAAPRLFRGLDVATNLQINATVSSNILTVAIKGADGNDPSTSSPVYIPFRDPTIANGDPVFLALTAATSIVAAVGASFGAPNSTPFRLWVVGFNDAGTFRLGLVNCLTIGPPTSIYPLRAKSNDVVSSTLIGAGSTSAQTFYTAGAGVTSKAFQILGYIEWSAGLATSGTFASVPTKIRLYGPGVATPGDMFNPIMNSPNTSGASTTSTTAVDVSNSSITITLTSACNVVRYDYSWQGQVAAGGAGVNTSYGGQLVRGAGPTLLWGAGSVGVTSASGTNMQTQASLGAAGLDPLLSVTSTAYKLQNKTTNAAGAAQTFLINGLLQEVMA